MNQEEHLTHHAWKFFYAPRGRNSEVTRKNSENYEKQLKNLGINKINF